MRELADKAQKIMNNNSVCERTGRYRTQDHEQQQCMRELADIEHKIMNNNSVWENWLI